MLTGDAKLTNEVPEGSSDQAPFQSFYFLPRPGNRDCYEAEPTLTIQTPGNITVNMMFNGVDTDFSPGTLLTITPTVCTIHRGNIIQRVGDNTASLLANQTVDIHIEENGTVVVDNLRGISEREYERGLLLQTTVNQLAVANGWGEQLITPPREYAEEPGLATAEPEATPIVEATVSPDVTAVNGETCQTIHTVLSGDTLKKIADRYGVTVDAIVAANQITNRNLIVPGQLLCIPEAASP
ncbi:MAG: LysM peptidoglycan-binding domain-containing protein [Anaerolineae bacterium]|nr:LysM peptidoglycan-binding domain-containing protein [Anaerolineae bacterium]